MLVLTRKPLEAVIVAEPLNPERRLKVTVLEVFNGKVRLGFEVDPNILVHRAEVWEKVVAVSGEGPILDNAADRDQPAPPLSDIEMMIDQGEQHELFTSISTDGTVWRFVILPRNQWAITCDDKVVANGGVDRASINSGVQKFMRYSTDSTHKKSNEMKNLKMQNK